MLRPGTGESSLPRMGLVPGAGGMTPGRAVGPGVDSAGSPGSGGRSGGCGEGAVAAGVGGADFATRVDGDGALGCGAQGSVAALATAAGLLGGTAGGVALGAVSAPSCFEGVLAFASPPRTRTVRMGKGFGGPAASGCVLSAGTSVPAFGAAACDLSCPSSTRMRCSMHCILLNSSSFESCTAGAGGAGDLTGSPIASPLPTLTIAAVASSIATL